MNDYKIRVSHCKTKWEVTINDVGLGDQDIAKLEFSEVLVDCSSRTFKMRSKDNKKLYFWWHVEKAQHEVSGELIRIFR